MRETPVERQHSRFGEEANPLRRWLAFNLVGDGIRDAYDPRTTLGTGTR